MVPNSRLTALPKSAPMVNRHATEKASAAAVFDGAGWAEIYKVLEFGVGGFYPGVKTVRKTALFAQEMM